MQTILFDLQFTKLFLGGTINIKKNIVVLE